MPAYRRDYAERKMRAGIAALPDGFAVDSLPEGTGIRTIGPSAEETPFPTPDVSFRANSSDRRHSLRGTEGSSVMNFTVANR